MYSGGAGTFNASVLSGVPTVVVPIFLERQGCIKDFGIMGHKVLARGVEVFCHLLIHVVGIHKLFQASQRRKVHKALSTVSVTGIYDGFGA